MASYINILHYTSTRISLLALHLLSGVSVFCQRNGLSLLETLGSYSSYPENQGFHLIFLFLDFLFLFRFLKEESIKTPFHSKLTPLLATHFFPFAGAAFSRLFCCTFFSSMACPRCCEKQTNINLVTHPPLPHSFPHLLHCPASCVSGWCLRSYVRPSTAPP